MYHGSLKNLNLAGNLPDHILCRMGRPHSPHTAIRTRTMIKQIFGNRVVGKHFPISWPPYSTDLTPADFWLWPTLKGPSTKDVRQNLGFSNHPPPLVRVCPNFQNHPLPGRPRPDFSIAIFELPYKYNLRIPLIKSIRQGGVLFTPRTIDSGQLTP